MPTIVGIFTFVNRKKINAKLSWAYHIITSRPDCSTVRYTTFTKFSIKYLMMCMVYTDDGGIK